MTDRKRSIDWTMIRREIVDLLERPEPVTLEEWKNLRGNSFEWEVLYGKLDDEAFAYVVRHNLKNCEIFWRYPAATYEEALVHVLVPELLRRLEGKKR